MPTLSIGESKPKKWKPLASLIMLIEGTDHSHSFVSYKDSRLPKVRYVAEARGSGFRVISNHHFKRENHVVRIFQYEVDQITLDEIHMEIHLLLAKPYSYKQLIGLLIMRIAKMFTIRIPNPFKDGKFSLICVEASARALFKAIKRILPSTIEDYGLKEMHGLNLKHGKQVSKEILARINSAKKA